jgi:hypothetical protein
VTPPVYADVAPVVSNVIPIAKTAS